MVLFLYNVQRPNDISMNILVINRIDNYVFRLDVMGSMLDLLHDILASE